MNIICHNYATLRRRNRILFCCCLSVGLLVGLSSNSCADPEGVLSIKSIKIHIICVCAYRTWLNTHNLLSIQNTGTKMLNIDTTCHLLFVMFTKFTKFHQYHCGEIWLKYFGIMHSCGILYETLLLYCMLFLRHRDCGSNRRRLIIIRTSIQLFHWRYVLIFYKRITYNNQLWYKNISYTDSNYFQRTQSKLKRENQNSFFLTLFFISASI